MPIPTAVPDEAALEELLSRPTGAVTRALGALTGDVLVLGAGGKMGPSLARLAVRASAEAGVKRRVIGVSRFAPGATRDALERDGVETIACDLLDPAALAALPEAANLVYMVGQKFGTTGDETRTWALNAFVPGLVAERFSGARIVAFSTGNVYPLAPADGAGPTELDPVGPIGEYAQSALARERVLEFFSLRQQTRVAILRLNYAIEPRYGVLRDIADRVWEGRPVDLAMAKVNVIWQRDANAVALQALAHCAVPPLVLNVTGPAFSVRWLAEQLGVRLGKPPVFGGSEGGRALLSDASRMRELVGLPEVSIQVMLDHVAEWVASGGRSLGKPTHFEEKEGRF